MPPRWARSPSTELALGDAPTALKLAGEARDIYQRLVDAAPDDLRYIHNLAYTDQTIADVLQQQGDFDGPPPPISTRAFDRRGGDRARNERIRNCVATNRSLLAGSRRVEPRARRPRRGARARFATGWR